MAQISATQIAAGLEGRSPAQIAAGVARMVNEGVVSPGDRLPIVHDLAPQPGVSTGTVAAAWNTLSALGLVESRGRAGTFVLPTPASWLPPRYRPRSCFESGVRRGCGGWRVGPDGGRAPGVDGLVSSHSYFPGSPRANRRCCPPS